MKLFAQPLFAQAQKCLNSYQRALLTDTQTIMAHLQKNSISDYSFLVAPAAKAYEGFLKKFFLQIGLIDEHQYYSDRFRVGKALNPNLRYKRYSIFQKMVDIDNSGVQLAQTLWQAWKQGRNLVFHYFPHNLQKLTLPQAKSKITQILNAIIQANQFLKLQDSTSEVESRRKNPP